MESGRDLATQGKGKRWEKVTVETDGIDHVDACRTVSPLEAYILSNQSAGTALALKPRKLTTKPCAWDVGRLMVV